MKHPLILTLSALLFATAQAQNCTGRLIQHAMGETCVPKDIKRLVVLDTGELDSALALGVKPVGAVQAIGGFPSYLKDRTDGITHERFGSYGLRAIWERRLFGSPSCPLRPSR